MKIAAFHFDEDLVLLLPKSRRDSVGSYSFTGPQSAKHLIEALGIPHTEVGSIIANGIPKGMGYLVQDGDNIKVSGMADGSAGTNEPRFAVDGHLGRLNSSLRMLGFDCTYAAALTENELMDAAFQEDRFLLTRNRRLLMRKSIVRGYLVRTMAPRVQLEEVTRRFDLRRWAQPFRRCIRCNNLLTVIDKQAVTDQLKPLTRLYFDEFRICPSCAQVYWKGSHFKRMQLILNGLGMRGPNHEPD